VNLEERRENYRWGGSEGVMMPGGWWSADNTRGMLFIVLSLTLRELNGPVLCSH